MKVQNIVELYSQLPENEKVIVDILRKFINDCLPEYCNEKISYNVPFFYGKKGLCIIWPASIPRGGIKTGVLLGFWYGNRLNDQFRYLSQGTNKQIFYKIIHDVKDINYDAIRSLLIEAVNLDKN